jgi:hypothetical protein
METFIIPPQIAQVSRTRTYTDLVEGVHLRISKVFLRSFIVPGGNGERSDLLPHVQAFLLRSNKNVDIYSVAQRSVAKLVIELPYIIQILRFMEDLSDQVRELLDRYVRQKTDDTIERLREPLQDHTEGVTEEQIKAVFEVFFRDQILTPILQRREDYLVLALERELARGIPPEQRGAAHIALDQFGGVGPNMNDLVLFNGRFHGAIQDQRLVPDPANDPEARVIADAALRDVAQIGVAHEPAGAAHQPAGAAHEPAGAAHEPVGAAHEPPASRPHGSALQRAKPGSLN